jgi:hypothetical protein
MKYQVRCYNLFKGTEKRDFQPDNLLLLSNSRQKLTFWDLTLFEFGSELLDTEHEIRKMLFFSLFYATSRYSPKVENLNLKGSSFSQFSSQEAYGMHGLIPKKTVRRLVPVTVCLSQNRYL